MDKPPEIVEPNDTRGSINFITKKAGEFESKEAVRVTYAGQVYIDWDQVKIAADSPAQNDFTHAFCKLLLALRGAPKMPPMTFDEATTAAVNAVIRGTWKPMTELGK